jgi:NADH dehydrogenase
MRTPKHPHILVVGGGYVGMTAALRLQRKLKRNEAKITVIDPNSFMTYQPFLPEAAAGSLQPWHVVVPLRRTLKGATVIAGEVTAVSHADRVATVQPREGSETQIPYDVLVVAVGGVSRTLPIPGLVDHAVGFKTVGEALFLRNHVLNMLDAAASTSDRMVRRCALTFVVVGGGYAGIEALAEMEDMARDALKYYPRLSVVDMRWVCVEAADRILPEVGEDLGHYTQHQLSRRGIDVRLNTRVESMVDGMVELSDGDRFPADTIVWTAGVRPHPVLESTDLPLDERRRVRCRPDLSIEGAPNAWSAGDCARVPDLSSDDPEATCAPSAQHAVRQARVLADNVLASVRGEPTRAYRHKNLGSVASLGLYKGVAQLPGVKVRGFPAWFMHRTYHLGAMPTFNRKVRIVADWTLALFLSREVVPLGEPAAPKVDPLSARKSTTSTTTLSR